MVRVLIGMSGSGKTYRLKEELVHKYKGGVKLKDICVIERKEYDEYSHIFHPDYVKVIKPDSSIVDSLLDARNMHIIIDCECYSVEFMEKVSVIVKRSIRNNNDVTITFLRIGDNILLEKTILMNADKILAGWCSISDEQIIENLFMGKTEPMRGKYDFRELKYFQS